MCFIKFIICIFYIYKDTPGVDGQNTLENFLKMTENGHQKSRRTPILEEEVHKAVQLMKRNKAHRPDVILTDMIKSIDDLGIKKLTVILYCFYDLCKFIFIALPKKSSAIECELHRTINNMSHVIKILPKLLMTRTRSRIISEISNTVWFFQRQRHKIAIFIFHILSKRAI